MNVIETAGLTRRFGRATAVDSLDLAVEAGQIVGLLGPNGAGKTTTIRMLTTLLAPSSGSARVCGFDVTAHPREVRKRIGYVMQRIAYRGLMTGRECVEVEASLYHLPRKEVQARAGEVLELVGLGPHADKLWTNYSGGMQKRLDLACGLLHRPQLLVLDEPSLGLDVQSRHHIWDEIRGLREQGVTVLLATNYLDEADRLCDAISIIDHGREVVRGTPEALKRAVGADIIEVAAADTDVLRQALEGQPFARQVTVTAAGEVHVFVEDAAAALPQVIALCLARGIELTRAGYKQPTLDDVFLQHTGRALREAEEALP